MLGWTLSARGPPLGPFTLMFWPATSIVTPAGMTTGCLPIRDMALVLLSPHRAKQLAAQALGAGLAIAHDALARADDADAQAVQHGLELCRAPVEPTARPARALNVPNDALAFRPVLQPDPQHHLRLR